ncbi:hypothetical protein jhhlp_003669 [Lomentospora prolificans]|uniref:Ubiquitin carrier protein n=1 Tax=Lomentospora prolificans TaxID=41688 RepID=A0A2N3N9D3_9PEZI|nr:hypothetical protein jhhlp_003669 [Lomentospora prolificans]
MFNHKTIISDVAAPLLKRHLDDVGDGTPQFPQFPKWVWGLFALDFIIFLPIAIFIGYTIGNVYPILAIVEDENAPPAYQPLSLDDPAPDANADVEARREGASNADRNDFPVTASLRRTHAFLKSTGGWRASFRGFFCFFVYGALYSFLSEIFGDVLGHAGTPVGVLLASVALVQINTAWVHIVLTPVSPLRWWKRLPPFGTTFRAVAFPTLLSVVATLASLYIPALISLASGIPFVFSPFEPAAPKDAKAAGLSILLLLLSLLLQLFLTLPALVILVRIQASLLPPDEDTIIPFDRSFGGRIEPAVVGGKPFASIRDAWATLSRSTIRRIVVLFIKIFAVNVGFWIAVAAFVVPQIFLGWHFAKGAPSSAI